MALIKLLKGGGIDGDDAVLYQSLGTDQLVVGGVVNDIQDASLAGGSYKCEETLESANLCQDFS